MIAREQIPNYLTYFRAASVPVLLLLILLTPEWHLIIVLVFGAAGITDYFDGYLARKWNVTNALGTMLDPIADKLLVALMMMYVMLAFGVSLLPVSIIILRELYIAGLREFLAVRQISLPVSKGGKWKTAAQMTGISLLLWAPILSWGWLLDLGHLMVWIAAALALHSAWDYTRASRQHLAS